VARMVFLGTPRVAVVALEALHRAGHDVALVVTRPDKRRGRGGDLSPSPVKEAALELGLPVAHEMGAVLEVGASLGVVVAYGRIIPAEILDALPMLNVHFSLLPRWRGAAPVERAILAGDTKTGVSIMRLDEGLDTGPVICAKAVEIGEDETAEELAERLARLGADLLVEVLSRGVDGLPPGEPQVGEATYAPKIEPGELRIDWSKSAGDIARLVRVGRAWTTFRNRRILVTRARPASGVSSGAPSGAQAPRGAVGSGIAPGTQGQPPGTQGQPAGTPEPQGQPPGTILPGCLVATGEGLLVLEEVRPEGRKAMKAEEWARGQRLGRGEAFDGQAR